MLTIDTPMGILRASRSNYANHPGIWIELQREGEKEFDPLVLVEYASDEENLPDNTEAIITKVWESHTNDEYSVRVIHDYPESIIPESTPSPYEEEVADNWKRRYKAKYAEGYEYGVDKVLSDVMHDGLITQEQADEYKNEMMTKMRAELQECTEQAYQEWLTQQS